MPNKSKHADLVKLALFRLRKKASNFTKPVFEALGISGITMKSALIILLFVMSYSVGSEEMPIQAATKIYSMDMMNYVISNKCKFEFSDDKYIDAYVEWRDSFRDRLNVARDLVAKDFIKQGLHPIEVDRQWVKDAEISFDSYSSGKLLGLCSLFLSKAKADKGS